MTTNCLIGFLSFYYLWRLTASGQLSNPNIFTSGNCTKIANNDKYITIGFLAGYGQTKLVLGALPVAVDKVNRDPLLLQNKTLRYKAYDIGSKSAYYRTFPISLMTQMRQENVLAFIGPDEGCTNEALVAAAWNMPMISYKCADTAVSNKTTFHSFARTLAPASKVSKSVISLLIAFKWTKFTIIAGTRPEWDSEVSQAIKRQAEVENLTVTNFREIPDYIPTRSTLLEMQRIVEETYQTTRIYVFVGEQFAMVDFVGCLQNAKLLETGEYVVISVDDDIYDPSEGANIMGREYLDPYLGTSKRHLNLASYQSVLKISQSHPLNPEFRKIADKIKDFSRKPPFNVPYHEKVFDDLTVPIYAAHLFDAILIYARAVTEALNANENIRDGRKIMKHIFDRSYKSIQGFDVYIDDSGDAEGNYTVIAFQGNMSSTAGAFASHRHHHRAEDIIKLSMQPVGYFVYNKHSTLPEFKYINEEKPIRWVNGKKPPRAEPKCGFYGQNCVTKKLDWKFLASGSFVALFLTLSGIFLIKHYRYEHTLACLLWKVDMKDVVLINVENSDFGLKTKTFVQTYRSSLIPGAEIAKRAYTTIGLYRGNIVAIKKIHKKSVDITRNMRKELKLMRELRHENIITFIGASIDHGSVAIITTYCARGSLENVLANKDLHLDNMFTASLVSDIVKGLIFLHDTDIISHGNLRSSNCLVDSRWVCQISDFGLHEFKAGQDETNKPEIERRRNLWRAPEILRDPNPLPRGSQKGDVYSFGVILYEIITRNGPWGKTSLSGDEIIARVKYPESFEGGGYFRPPIVNLNASDHIKQCLIACWDEEPENRPDIRLVRMILKPMQSGLKPNIFDNMLAIMEKYAYSLEGLVQERTKQLREEKKRTETLLLRMLPKTVTEALKTGKPVEAESFDCVTIFFSDLVGFTQICAKSTPMEVVEMLNDLYTCCDSIISNYDVYKVETIGDAYMVVSGCPIRNGNLHAGEIASLALELLKKVSKLEIRHRPGEYLQFRIGIHSGQCVAGVVGLKMPRYCLFGDTVCLASRMESTGEPLKIQISESTYYLLQKLGGFSCQKRGLIFIKGKGEMTTYWLISESKDSASYKRRVASAQLLEAHNVTPDLLCSTEAESRGQQIRHTSSPCCRSVQRVRSKLSQTYLSEQLISHKLYDGYGSSGGPGTECLQCGSKKFYEYIRQNRVFLSATDFETTHETENICLCNIKESIGTRRHQHPKSAPHISFMQ